AMRRNRIRVLFYLGRTDEALSETNDLLRTDLGQHEASVLLLHADLTQGEDVPATIDTIRQALAKGLSKAEDAYAHALIATTTPKAIASLRDSLALDPYQPRARAMLAVLLLLLGRREEARLETATLAGGFPEDINV